MTTRCLKVKVNVGIQTIVYVFKSVLFYSMAYLLYILMASLSNRARNDRKLGKLLVVKVPFQRFDRKMIVRSFINKREYFLT